VINYYADGEVFSKGDYRNGLPNGEWEFFDEKGRKVTSGMLQDGVKEGAWEIYYKNGQLTGIEVYSNGVLIQSRSGMN